MKKQHLMVALCLAVAGTAFAQAAPRDSAATPRIDQREARQQQRIGQGVASGQLTGREAAHLEREQGRIQSAEARAKSDGKVTARERAHITRMQDRASRDIARDKHNGRRS